MGIHSFFRVNLGMWPLKSTVLDIMSTVVMVSTHIYSISKDIGGENIHFTTKPSHVTPQIDSSWQIWALFWGSQHTFYSVCKDIGRKMFIFQLNLGMWPLKSIISEKKHCSEDINTHYGVSNKIDGKAFIFRVNLAMWTSQIDCLRNMSTVLNGLNTHL